VIPLQESAEQPQVLGSQIVGDEPGIVSEDAVLIQGKMVEILGLGGFNGLTGLFDLLTGV